VVREKLQAIQYDMEDTPDVIDMTASILCKAELEAVPEVTLNLVYGKQIENLTFHPCVHAVDSATKKLVFSPPLDQISLCDFGLKGIDIFPLRGYYQMKVSFSCAFLSIFPTDPPIATLRKSTKPASKCWFSSSSMSPLTTILSSANFECPLAIGFALFLPFLLLFPDL